ncbi:hypothetical protein llap_7788 [Limosa lapponica baueri]|uniref:Uncharacterized protein n=1 Tax=Limosa lapponica baueri TaxID=1758121 RepID=A0A2I0U7B9_LIMLA|nr:hypothetical protein llap_7788 [Limosa lapponica baueri]
MREGRRHPTAQELGSKPAKAIDALEFHRMQIVSFGTQKVNTVLLSPGVMYENMQSVTPGNSSKPCMYIFHFTNYSGGSQ